MVVITRIEPPKRIRSEISEQERQAQLEEMVRYYAQVAKEFAPDRLINREVLPIMRPTRPVRPIIWRGTLSGI